ncbi:uncharacterized protein POS17_3422 [Pseudomonas sp. Os17]|uniref:hypothetical protein n=1 Tax=Pseudomonas sp. Os17 TaxID=1500686 RepID=UPI0005FC5483|nr:hypothetical protein [Pseudomonas sp. Os17]BAQ75116.1 uncharacterized protein POS17_3422 [Pseudomonas sp. Os17]
MSVRFITQSPAGLLKLFDQRIGQTEREGSITTWRKTPSGNFTHVAERWGAKAYFKPRTDIEGRLVFNIIPPAGERIEPEVYSYYHAHLIETFLNHFPNHFSRGEATSKPTKCDNLVSKTAK